MFTRLRRRPCTAGRWASPSTATRSARSRSSSTSRCCRATSASPAPGCARCAVTRTCRATGRWASGSARRTHFLDALRDEFGFDPPREHGLDTVDSIRALRDGKAQGVRRPGRQLRLGHARHRGDRGRAAQRRPDRAGVDQAEPLARRVRADGADPAGARPHRAGPHRRPRRRRSPSRTRCRRCTRRAVRWSRRASTCAPRSTSSARSPRPPSATATASPWSEFRARLRDDPPPHRPRRARLRGVRREDRAPGGFVLPHPPRDTPHLPHRGGQGRVLGQPDRGAARAARAPAAADPAQPRPVQHHDLRPRRPLPRHLRRPPGRVRPPRRRRRRSGSPTATWSTWSASGRTARSARAGFRVVPYDPAGLRGGLLPGDEPAGPARLDGDRQQHPDVQVGHRPARAGLRERWREWRRHLGQRAAPVRRPTRSPTRSRTSSADRTPFFAEERRAVS